MSSSEFDIIRRYFTDQQSKRADVSLGIGDDAALLQPASGQSLVVSVDTLVSGVHFPVDTPPGAIGHKALAVNLSDMAAMGGEPAWFTLAITLPDDDESWLTQFSHGLFDLAREHNIQLVGGDTTRSPQNGPLSITIQIMGFVPDGLALTRSGAVAGDAIYVTGSLGDAGAGLYVKQGLFKPSASVANLLVSKLEKPRPQIAVGLALRGLANAAIDISDGLNADLGHIITASNVGADISIDNLPLSDAYRSLKLIDSWHFAASAGDDYELCFTVNESNENEMLQELGTLGCTCTKIGTISAQPGLRWFDNSGGEQLLSMMGYDHFKLPDEIRN
jgi:thiamine-monophosphate kinase